jgi:hypothetical protein
MTKEMAVSFLGNRIYYGNILKDGTMSDNRIDLTDQVIRALFTHMKNMHETKGHGAYQIKGVGEIRFTPENKLQD